MPDWREACIVAAVIVGLFALVIGVYVAVNPEVAAALMGPTATD